MTYTIKTLNSDMHDVTMYDENFTRDQAFSYNETHAFMLDIFADDDYNFNLDLVGLHPFTGHEGPRFLQVLRAS